MPRSFDNTNVPIWIPVYTRPGPTPEPAQLIEMVLSILNDPNMTDEETLMQLRIELVGTAQHHVQ